MEVQGDPKKKYTRLVKYFSTAICKIHTKRFTSTKRKANLNFGVSFMKFKSIFVVLWPLKLRITFKITEKKTKNGDQLLRLHIVFKTS